MSCFDSADYFSNCTDPLTRSAETTIKEYLQLHKRFTRECIAWLKDNNNNLNRMNQAGARTVFDELRARYCISKNRQYLRSTIGHYYLFDVANAEVNLEVVELTDKTGTFILKADPLHHVIAHRIILKKVGEIWRMVSLEAQAGIGNWIMKSL